MHCDNTQNKKLAAWSYIFTTRKFKCRFKFSVRTLSPALAEMVPRLWLVWRRLCLSHLKKDPKISKPTISLESCSLFLTSKGSRKQWTYIHHKSKTRAWLTGHGYLTFPREMAGRAGECWRRKEPLHGAVRSRDKNCIYASFQGNSRTVYSPVFHELSANV